MGMRLVFVFAFWLLFAAWARAEGVAGTLQRHAEHGTVSPEVAKAELQAAADRPGNTADLRGRYYFALGVHAANAKDEATVQTAARELRMLSDMQICQSCSVRALLIEGILAAKRQRTRDARRILDQLLSNPPQDPLTLINLRLLQSSVLARGGHFDEAIAAAIEAAQLAETLKRPADQLRAMNRMVVINTDKRDFARAEDVAKDASVLAKRIGDIEYMVHLRNNQVVIHSLRGEHDLQYQALLDLQRMTLANPALTESAMTTQINLADYHIDRQQYAKAVEHATAGEKLARGRGDAVAEAIAKTNRAIALSYLGQVPEAVALLKASVATAEKEKANNIAISLYEALQQVLERNGQTAEALKVLHRVLELRVAQFESQRQEAVLEMQEKYSAERKSREIERLSIDNARKQAEVDARTWEQRLWALVAAVLMLGSAMLVQWLRRSRRRNRNLETDNAVLSRQSSSDPLTSAYNRRHCQWLMEHKLAGFGSSAGERNRRSADGRAGVGMVLLDIDFFKKVNDVHGHAAGDTVLVEVASRLQGLIRDKDALVRWGGEEFVLILPGALTESVRTVVDRVLRAIGDEPVLAGTTPIPVTISAGCIVWPAFPGQHWEDALHMADLALYLSKSRGRNRATCVHDVAADADLDRVRSDLGDAEARHLVTLRTVLGPEAVTSPH